MTHLIGWMQSSLPRRFTLLHIPSLSQRKITENVYFYPLNTKNRAHEIPCAEFAWEAYLFYDLNITLLFLLALECW